MRSTPLHNEVDSNYPITVWKQFPLSFNNQQFEEMEKIEQVAQITVQRGIVLKGTRVKDDLAGIGVSSYAELNKNLIRKIKRKQIVQEHMAKIKRLCAIFQ